MIFRVSQLQGAPAAVQEVAQPKPKKPQQTGGSRAVPKVTRAADPAPDAALPRVQRPSQPTPARPSQPKPRPVAENTREMAAVAPPADEPSGLLTLGPPGAPPAPRVNAAQKRAWADAAETQSIDEELENVGDRTVITAPAGTIANARDPGDDEIDYSGGGGATMITAAPRRPDTSEEDESTDVGRGAPDNVDAEIEAALARDLWSPASGSVTRGARDAAGGGGMGDDVDDDAQTLAPEDDGPTIQRDFRDATGKRKAKVTEKRAPAAPVPAAARTKKAATPTNAPPALAAKIHSPAVSELRKPRPSRRTPPGGIVTPTSGGGSGSVLQAIVGAQSSEPMPTPRPMPVTTAPPPPNVAPPPLAMPPPPPPLGSQPDAMIPGAMPPYGAPQYPPYPPGQPPYGAPPPGAPPQMAMPPLSVGSPLASPMSGVDPFAYGTPGPGAAPPPYGAPFNPLALGAPTPPPGMAVQSMPGVPPHLQPYAQMGHPSQPQMGPPGYPMYPTPPGAPAYPSPPGFPAMSPAAMYHSQQMGMSPSLTGQLRLSEGDELPSAYKIGGGQGLGEATW